MSHILIIGATSAIAQEVAKLYAEKGSKLFLVARDNQKLDQVAMDLKVRGAGAVDHLSQDLLDTDQHAILIKKADEALGSIDIALIAHGTLPDQKQCENSVDQTLQELQINFL